PLSCQNYDMGDNDLSSLTALEQSIGLVRPPFGRRFVRTDRWLVAESIALSKLALGPFRQLGISALDSLDHHLQLPRLDFGKECWFEKRRLWLPLRCSALYRGTGTRRAFYLSRSISIKIQSSSRAATSDVEARTLIDSIGKLKVPRIISSGVLNDR